MGYKCANCGIDFPDRRKIVEHMIDSHDSPYVEGDERMIAYSEEYAKKQNNTEALKHLGRRL